MPPGAALEASEPVKYKENVMFYEDSWKSYILSFWTFRRPSGPPRRACVLVGLFGAFWLLLAASWVCQRPPAAEKRLSGGDFESHFGSRKDDCWTHVLLVALSGVCHGVLPILGTSFGLKIWLFALGAKNAPMRFDPQTPMDIHDFPKFTSPPGASQGTKN